MATYKDVLMLVDKVTAPLKKISEQTKKTNEQLNKAKVMTSTFTQKLRNFGVGFANIGKNVFNIGKRIIGVFAAISSAITLAGGKVLGAANKYAEMGDRIDKMSQKIGMSRKAFQEWDYIMSQNGGNVETLQMGFKTLVTQIDGVRKGSKESVAAFKSLGVSVKDNNGQFRSADDVFNDTVSALQKIKNPTQKMILANKLFGRSAAELRPLLNQEAEAVDELRKKANKMGLILSDKDIDNAREYKDTMDTFSRFFEAKFAGVMMKIMPDLSKSLEEIMQIATENQEAFENIGQVFKWLATKGVPAVARSILFVINMLRNIGTNTGNLIGTIMSIPTQIQIAWMKLTLSIRLLFINLGRELQTIVSNLYNAFNSIFEKLREAFSALASGIGGVFNNVLSKIQEWIQWIIDKVKFVAKLIPGVSQAVSRIENKVNQTQNNNTTNNTTNITNNYGGGSQGGSLGQPALLYNYP